MVTGKRKMLCSEGWEHLQGLLLAQGPVPTGPTLGRFRCIWSFLLGSKRWDGIKERTAQLDVSKYFPPRKRNTSRGWYSQEVVYAL